MKKTLTTEQFIERAKKAHGDRYDYSQAIYVRNNIPIKIICKKHGLFEIKPISHTVGKGCSICGRERTIKAVKDRKEVSLEKLLSKISHENFIFPKIKEEYKGYKSTITIACKYHGEFTREVRACVFNGVCPKCSVDRRSGIRRYSISEIEEKLKSHYGDRYSYPYLSSEYKNNQSKITISCKIHGEFVNKAASWLLGNGGCSRCYGDSMSEHKSMLFSEFVFKSNKRYGHKYSYCRVKWEKQSRNRKEPIEILCPIHGPFKQTVNDHLNSCLIGCPSCAITESFFEKEVKDYINSLGLKTVSRNRKIIKPLELDIYIPSKKIAIECNGLYYHRANLKGRNYHKDKRIMCEKKGVRLIQIWDNEWVENKEKVKRYLKNTLIGGSTRVFARKCEIKTPSKEEAINMLDKNHLIGVGNTNSEYIGLYYKEKLVSLMAFKKGFNGVELHRYINDSETVVVGGFSKLLKHYSSKCGAKQIVSYIDLDKFVGGAYLKSGFVKDSLSLTMFYCKGQKAYSKFKFRRKYLKSWNNYSEDKTEKEICEEAGYFQCFNSGTMKVILYLDNFIL